MLKQGMPCRAGFIPKWNRSRRRSLPSTPREREVLIHVVAGRLNKQIAGDLGTVEKTIKVHRSRMMEKLGIRTVADLVRMSEKLNLTK